MPTFGFNNLQQLLGLVNQGVNTFNAFQGGGGATGGFFPQQQNQSLIPGINNQLLGSLLLGGSSLIGRDEPGHVTEARQVLRNMSSPGGFSSMFGQTVGGLQPQFQEFFDQRDQRAMGDLTQRIKAAFPATAGVQGGEIGSIARLLGEQLDPARNAFLGNIGLSGLNTQFNAANEILQASRPDPFRAAMAALGGSLLAGQGGGLGGGGGGGLEQLLGGLTGQGGAGGGGGGLIDNIIDIIGGSAIPGQISANLGGILPAISGGVGALTFPQLFGGAGALTGSPLAATQIAQSPQVLQLAQALGVPPDVVAAQLASGGGAAGAGATGGGFLSNLANFQGIAGAPGLSSLSGLLSGALSGGAGFGIGNLIGGQLPGTQLGASAGGAGGGAAAGFALGGPIGAAIGALAGGVGGFFGSRSASHAQKAANLKADQNSQAGQARAVADFFLPQIEALGGDVNGLMDQVSSLINNVNDPGDQQAQLASLLGGAMLQAAQAVDPSVQNLGDIPGVRQNFLSFMSQNAFVEPSAGNRSALGTTGAGAQQFATLAESAGFRPGIFSERGGVIAAIGEAFLPVFQGQLLERGEQPHQGMSDFVDAKINLSRDGAEINLIKDTLQKLGSGIRLNVPKTNGVALSLNDVPGLRDRFNSILSAAGISQSQINQYWNLAENSL